MRMKGTRSVVGAGVATVWIIDMGCADGMLADSAAGPRSRHSMEEGALGQNLENAAISFVLEDVLGQSNQIVW